jgi:hypothetical protein
VIGKILPDAPAPAHFSLKCAWQELARSSARWRRRAAVAGRGEIARRKRWHEGCKKPLREPNCNPHPRNGETPMSDPKYVTSASAEPGNRPVVAGGGSISASFTPPGNVGANFSSSNGGSVQGTASGPALMPDSGLLAINGSSELSSCICGPSSDAAVHQLWVMKNGNPLYAYAIIMNAQGPTGMGTNLWLVLTDATGDQYKIKIHDSSLEQHWIQYNSTGPGITSVAWYPTDP